MKIQIDPPVMAGMLAALVGALVIAEAHPLVASALGGWVAWCVFYYAIKNRH